MFAQPQPTRMQFMEAAYDDWLASIYDAWYPELWSKRDAGPTAPDEGPNRERQRSSPAGPRRGAAWLREAQNIYKILLGVKY